MNNDGGLESVVHSCLVDADFLTTRRAAPTKGIATTKITLYTN
jgi:hypothetical protein